MYQDARRRERDTSSHKDLVKQEEGKNLISDEFIAPRLWLSHPPLPNKHLRGCSRSLVSLNYENSYRKGKGLSLGDAHYILLDSHGRTDSAVVVDLLTPKKFNRGLSHPTT